MMRTRPGLADAAHGVLRIVTGLLFMQHGVQKLFGWLGGVGPPGEPAPLFSLFGLAGVLEVFGGALIVLGLLTRLVALILALEMLAAYVTTHLPLGFWPVLNQGEPALLFAFIYLYLAAAGPGRFALDNVLLRRRQGAEAPTAQAAAARRRRAAGE